MDTLWSRGDVSGAHRSSRISRRWNLAAVISGVLIAVLGGVIFGIRNVTSFSFRSDMT